MRSARLFASVMIVVVIAHAPRETRAVETAEPPAIETEAAESDEPEDAESVKE